jgi:hypothetical protein
MFGGFVGQFYALGIWKTTSTCPLLKYKPTDFLESESLINQFLLSNEALMQNAITFLSPVRAYKGVIVDFISSEESVATHDATMMLN